MGFGRMPRMPHDESVRTVRAAARAWVSAPPWQDLPIRRRRRPKAWDLRLVQVAVARVATVVIPAISKGIHLIPGVEGGLALVASRPRKGGPSMEKPFDLPLREKFRWRREFSTSRRRSRCVLARMWPAKDPLCRVLFRSRRTSEQVRRLQSTMMMVASFCLVLLA